MMKRWLIRISALVFAFGGTVPLSYADALHGFCWGTTPVCTDNGTNTPTSTNPPNFGFVGSGSGGEMGDYRIDVLVPDTVSNPSSLSFSITGGANSPATASLFSTTAWTSGNLDAYLGISASPQNPIGAFSAGGSGFYVYQADLGTNTLGGTGGCPPTCGGPHLSISPGVPIDSYLVGFLNTGTAGAPSWIATANSGAIFVNHGVVPEPATLLLLGSGMAGIGLWRRLKSQN